jgi:hypothetical protein
LVQSAPRGLHVTGQGTSLFSGIKPTYSGPGDEQFNQPIVTDWQDYLALFEPGSQYAARGEASPSYLDLYRTAVGRIKAAIPQAKIIIILRHPTTRAFSEYVHLVRDGRETLSFRESLDAEDERMRQGWRRIWAHKARGFYSAPVAAYLEAFGRENVGIWLYERMTQNPAATFREMCHFIGVDDEFSPFFSQVNVGGVPRIPLIHRWLNRPSGFMRWVRRLVPTRLRSRLRQSVDQLNLGRMSMSDEDRAYLNAYYRDEIRKLEALLPDVDFSIWTRAAAREPSRLQSPHSAPARL